MITIEEYPEEYKFLPVELIIFFDGIFKDEQGRAIPKTLFDFCEFYRGKYNTLELPQPRIVSQICEKLVKLNYLTVYQTGGFDNLENSYVCFLKDKSFITDSVKFNLQNSILAFKIYGFKYIYECYKPLVLPIIYKKDKKDDQIGSSFLYKGGLLTAKHCIEYADKIAIKGIPAETLNRSKFYIHDNPMMDLIYIEFPEKADESIVLSEEADVLDEVIALGYPRTPGFHNFLTGEKADISSRFRGLEGSTAAIAEDIWIRENLLLITAKIKGGNSGGPIIKRNGSVAAVASNLPEGDGDYDDLGYGVAIPIKFADEIINKKANTFDVSKIEFVEFKD